MNALKSGVPWYRNANHYFELATQYIDGARSLSLKNSLANKELESYEEFNVINLIFESNLIEGAGAKTRGETEEIIKDNSLILPEKYQAFKDIAQVDAKISKENIKKIKDSLDVVNKARKTPIVPSVKFNNKSRKAIEVLRHQVAWRYSAFLVYQYKARERLALIRDYLNKSRSDFKGRENLELVINKYLEKNDVTRVRRTWLFGEVNIKAIHKKLGYGQLRAESGVEAGDYRINDAHIDHKIKFPSPDLLKSCMSNFARMSQRDIGKFYENSIDVYELAARVSYDFVAIHPFPDFNGRTSRLIMNMALKLYDPRILPISLRGDAKSKRNYFYSLNLCGRGNYIPFAALIAKRVCEIYADYDSNLIKAGLQSILKFSPQYENASGPSTPAR